MIELSNTDKTVLGFKLDISGNSEVPVSNFVLKVSEEIFLMFPARIMNDKAIVNVPPLSFLSTMEAGNLEAYLEVIVDNQYFKPWEGSAVFKPSVKIQASLENTPIEANEDTNKSKVSAILETEEVEEEKPNKKETPFKDFISKKQKVSLDKFLETNIQ